MWCGVSDHKLSGGPLMKLPFDPIQKY